MDPSRRRGRAMALCLAAGLLAGMATPASAAVAPLPACAISDTLTEHRSLTDWKRALLDTDYRLASSHKPRDLRSTAKAGLNGGYSVRAFVIKDLKKMATAARRAGARLAVQSAYRSYATQRSTFAYWVRVHGQARALRESARAGHSEHQLGTTLDLRSYGGKAPWDYKDWGTTKAGKWLRKNAWKYGFIVSYPKGKAGVTCYTYEPWHVRYVGRSVAKKVHASGVTLRQYLWQRQAPEVVEPPVEPPVVEPPVVEPPPAPDEGETAA